MLTKEQIVDLNDRMLCLGIPDERDEIGYNKPDYSLMSWLAYIPPEQMNNELVVVLLDTLAHYSNTQLTSYKEEIQETAKEYKRELLLQGNENILSYMETGDTSFLKGANEKYIPKELRKEKHYNVISVLQYNEKGLLLDFEDVQAAHRFKNNNQGVYYTQKEGGWKLFVPYDKLTDFVELMKGTKKKGIDGYVPSEQLAKIVEDIPAFVESLRLKNEAEKEETVAKKLVVSLVRNDIAEGKITVFFEGFNHEMNEYKKEHYPSVKNVNENGEWHTVIDYKAFDKWLNKAKEAGLNPSEELTNINIQSLLEEKERFLNELHKGKHELVDVTKLSSLPFVPYDFQLEDARKLLERDRMLLGHDMGCGKSFISALLASSIEGKKLVICPATLRLNWKREMKNVDIDADILYSKDEFNINPSPNSVTIIGYQTATKYADKLIDAGFSTLFVDEVHNCKSVDNSGRPSSQRAKSVIDIATKVKNVYLLSGTPIPTRNKDLYNVLKMLDVKEIDFNKNFTFFKYGREYCDAVNNGYGWSFEGNSNSDKLHDLLSPYMVRRLKSDVLPNLTKQRIFIPLEIHNREYNKIEKRILNLDEGDTYMGLAMTGRRLLSESKVEAATEFADGLLNEDKSVVIVSNFNDTLNKLKEKYGDNCCVIRGGMSDEQKQSAIDNFQSGKCKVCALNIIAGGVGVTLTKAHDMIICDYDWTPANMSQVEDRICRAGQTEGCNIHYLYGDNCLIDELFIQMITDKSSNIDRVIDGTENTMDLKSIKTDNSKSYLDLLKGYAEAHKNQDVSPKPKKKKEVQERT